MPYLKTNKMVNLLVIFILFLRAFLNAVIPFMDKTEARYAEIARIMAETQQWIMPQIDYGIPFWAKPPLSTWFSALSISAFGNNEFFVRLPALLLSIGILFLVGKYAKKENLPFFLPGLILLTIPEFILHTGVVSTDVSLSFCVVLTMLSFWETMQKNSKNYWKYLFFVGLGFGLLAKGPIVFILTFPPLFLWTIIHKKHFIIWKKFPWILGILIVGFISIPWYYLAEKESEGFINYFIVGEHFKRFFDASWSGDKYGFPKIQPLGIVWIFLLLFTLPWCFSFGKNLWTHKKQLLKKPWVSFLFLWFLWTPIFFTVSKSLIHPYILPVMVPFALLILHWWKTIRHKKTQFCIGFLIPFLAILVFISTKWTGDFEYYIKSDKYLLKNTVEEIPLYYLEDKTYSSQFYSQGKIQQISMEDLQNKIENKEALQIIIEHKKALKMDIPTYKKLKVRTQNKNKAYYTFNYK
ncbi:ArnT family glycosyltransferase [Aureivirga sp. CE67]|uniref:ArnT family glycosyltransferase n=1 Tax=Aureivirga sp. CE67 TaxID=1788983 RepID=UPI0018C923DA|nr:glycosyltransferase family 39 protein [Aureivirga sp. CE67]